MISEVEIHLTNRFFAASKMLSLFDVGITYFSSVFSGATQASSECPCRLHRELLRGFYYRLFIKPSRQLGLVRRSIISPKPRHNWPQMSSC